MAKKGISLLLVMLLCVLVLPVTPVSAAAPDRDNYNEQVKSYADSITQTYKIKVKYPIREDGYAAIGIGTLSTLEKSLEYLSVEFVAKLSEYYYKEYGQWLTLEYTYLTNTSKKTEGDILGSFLSSQSLILLYIPDKNSHMTTSGNSPLVILHEIGHAFYLYLANTKGLANIKTEWLPFNEGYAYGWVKQNPNRCIFVSAYAAQDLVEDFAETFAYMFYANRAGLGIAHRLHDEQAFLTGLGKKINCIEANIEETFGSLKGAAASIQKMYRTAAVTTYNGVELSGNSLEYKEFSPPYGIVQNVLAQLKIEAVTVDWDGNIGGWRVTDKLGGLYLVFPGSGYVTLSIPTKSTKEKN